MGSAEAHFITVEDYRSDFNRSRERVGQGNFSDRVYIDVDDLK
jgi:hypothetical protein